MVEHMAKTVAMRVWKETLYHNNNNNNVADKVTKDEVEMETGLLAILSSSDDRVMNTNW